MDAINARYAQKERTSVLDRVINFNTVENRRTRDNNDDVGGHVGKEKLRSVPLYAITSDIFS